MVGVSLGALRNTKYVLSQMLAGGIGVTPPTAWGEVPMKLFNRDVLQCLAAGQARPGQEFKTGREQGRNGSQTTGNMVFNKSNLGPGGTYFIGFCRDYLLSLWGRNGFQAIEYMFEIGRN